jgi:hypothetical protein
MTHRRQKPRLCDIRLFGVPPGFVGIILRFLKFIDQGIHLRPVLKRFDLRGL